MHKREVIWNALLATLLMCFAVSDYKGISALPCEYAAEFTRFVLVALFITASLSIRSIFLALAEEKIIFNLILFSVYWSSMCQWVTVL